MARTDGFFPPCPPGTGAGAGNAITTGPFFVDIVNTGEVPLYFIILKNPTIRDFNVDVTIDSCEIVANAAERSCTRNFSVPANSCLTFLVSEIFDIQPPRSVIITRVTVSGDVSAQASKVEVFLYPAIPVFFKISPHWRFVKVVNPKIHQEPNQDCTNIIFTPLDSTGLTSASLSGAIPPPAIVAPLKE